MKSENICHLLVAHHAPDKIDQLIERWGSFYSPPSSLLLCYGGTQENFSKITYEPKIFLNNPRLRTRDHQRDKQSYTEIFQEVASWLKEHPEQAYIYLIEYDHWPLVLDLDRRLIERLKREKADILGHQLTRRDRTSCVFYLYHLSDERFLPWLKQISRRQDNQAVFNMFGSGTFWTREAFLAVSQVEEPFPIYLETYLPTLAHHLGFRLRDFEEQNKFISAEGDRYGDLQKALEEGAWTLHPVKTWPSTSEG